MLYLAIVFIAISNISSLEISQQHRSVSQLKTAFANNYVVPKYPDVQHSVSSSDSLVPSSMTNDGTVYASNSPQVEREQLAIDAAKESIGEVVFNTHHFTQFLYGDEQVFVYSPKKNDENILEPQKWAFYYVPILQPIKVSSDSQWIWIHKNEVRVRLALGNPDVEKAARRAIADQFDNETVEQYSKLWVVAPLMMDSLSAYIVTVSSSLVDGVAPFHIDNPISNSITFRFECVANETAQSIATSLLEGDYDIEVSFYFAGMHSVKTNMITITATQLQAVLSKTIADGGGTNATYIHRDQASSFVAKYVANVKKMIYIEDPTTNMTLLTNGLEEQFTALFQEGKHYLYL